MVIPAVMESCYSKHFKILLWKDFQDDVDWITLKSINCCTDPFMVRSCFRWTKKGNFAKEMSVSCVVLTQSIVYYGLVHILLLTHHICIITPS